jgi:hypothetical protein
MLKVKLHISVLLNNEGYSQTCIKRSPKLFIKKSNLSDVLFYIKAETLKMLICIYKYWDGLGLSMLSATFSTISAMIGRIHN